MSWAQCDACTKWRVLFAGSPPVGDGEWTCAMNALDPLRNACTAPEQDEDEVAAVEAAVEAAAAEGRQAAAAAEEEGEEEEDDGFDDDDDDDDEGLIVDGVSFGEDRRAEAEEAAWEALGGVPKEIDVYWPEDR